MPLLLPKSRIEARLQPDCIEYGRLLPSAAVAFVVALLGLLSRGDEAAAKAVLCCAFMVSASAGFQPQAAASAQSSVDSLPIWTWRTAASGAANRPRKNAPTASKWPFAQRHTIRTTWGLPASACPSASAIAPPRADMPRPFVISSPLS